GITAACYTFLLLYRVPLPPFSPPGDDGSTFIVHVIGMWLGFVLSAVLIAQFVVSMGQTLRDQERSLAEARERALRDERVVALATLAAGAAHELSTPLGTMALVTAELAEEYPSEPPRAPVAPTRPAPCAWMPSSGMPSPRSAGCAPGRS
ncbi:MAG: hypothetical protein L6Q83_07895, partial [Gammaproteobacteria bacterium]|nr:hypothetical protein [Gammaproteobacteria bacterium]